MATLRRSGKLETQANTRRVVRASLAALLAIAVAARNGAAASGMTVTDFGAGTYAEAHAAVFWPNAKVIAAGHAHVSNGVGFALARYSTATGALDPSFGNGGKVTTPFSGGFAVVNALARRGNRILAAGVSGSDAALAQYTDNGAIDWTFGTGGKVTTNFGLDDVFNAVGVVQPILAPTRLVAAGSTGTFAPNSHDFAVAFYDGRGIPLSGVGTSGKVKIPFFAAAGGPIPTDDFATSLAVQTNGKVVVGGYAHSGDPCVSLASNFALARLNADGTLDATFGGGGKVLTTVGPIDHLNALRIQADGKIVAAGATRATCGGEVHLVLVRYHANGTIDASFGAGGVAIANFDPALHEIGTDLQIQADGKLVVVGRTGPVSGNVPNGFSAIVARFTATGVPDPSFGNGGYALVHVGDGDDYTYGEAVALDAAGGVLPIGTFVPGSGPGAGFFAARLTPFGDLDPAFGQ